MALRGRSNRCQYPDQCFDCNKRDIASLFLKNYSRVDFVVPEFSLSEIKKHEKRICSVAKIKEADFNQSLLTILNRSFVINDDYIPEKDFKKAYEMTYQIDPDDIIYVAFALAMDALLWTGDLILYRGLRRKGFNNVITTSELKEILKGLT